MSLKLYGIPNCDTVKKARDFLSKHHLEYTFIDFKKTPPTIALIKAAKDFVGDLPVNKSGVTYKKYKDEYEKLSEAKKIDFMITQSSMIKRPILTKNDQIICLGFSAETYAKLF